MSSRRSRTPSGAKDSPRLPFLGTQGCGQDLYRRILAKAVNCARRREGGAVQQLRDVQGHRLGRVCRRHRDRRRLQQGHRRDKGAPGDGAIPAYGGQAQGLHHRRGAHAHRPRVQRAPEDPGGAAGPQHFHPRNDRIPQDPLHYRIQVPALRFQENIGIADHRAIAPDLLSKRDRVRREGP